jgi:hypothetical protein
MLWKHACKMQDFKTRVQQHQFIECRTDCGMKYTIKCSKRYNQSNYFLLDKCITSGERRKMPEGGDWPPKWGCFSNVPRYASPRLLQSSLAPNGSIAVEFHCSKLGLLFLICRGVNSAFQAPVCWIWPTAATSHVIKLAFDFISKINSIARKIRGKDPVVGEIQNSSHFP